MRLAIIADIHGNYRALDAVLTDISEHGVDRIVSLGDNIGYGPEPEEVVSTLQGYRVISVMGNHELALVSRGYFNRLHATARQSLELSRSLLSQTSLRWLKELPPVEILFGARFVHGSPPESMTVYLHNPTTTRLQRLFATYTEPYCFAGHTHALGWYSMVDSTVSLHDLTLGPKRLDPESRHLIVPGSVGQPRDSLSWQAKYLLWDQENDSMEMRAVDYDVKTTIHLIKERGFPIVNGKRLYW